MAKNTKKRPEPSIAPEPTTETAAAAAADNRVRLVENLAMGVRVKGEAKDGYSYSGVEHFLLREGRWYTPQPRPSGYKLGPINQCFMNAYLLASESDTTLRYVEGCAASADDPLGFHHAWCTDADGNVVDVTLRKPGVAYLGVEFPDREVGLSWTVVGRANILWPQLPNDELLRGPSKPHFNDKLLRKPWKPRFNRTWGSGDAIGQLVAGSPFAR